MVDRDRLFLEIDLANFEINRENFVKYYDAALLGQICINRLGGLAYYRLIRDANVLDGIPNEYLKVLSSVYQSNLIRTEKYLENLKHISVLFADANFKHAFLKGAFLSSKLYPKGLRVSNDIDILVMQKDISSCQKILTDNGFIQGQERGSEIIPASRIEIINSRMNYGETIPFHKKYNNSIITLDINFSLDYKPEEDAILIENMLDSVTLIDIGDGDSIHTMDTVHFLIHLCCHLYKEATTYEWLNFRSDLTLYKFVDICAFIDVYGSEKIFKNLIITILELNLVKECYYTFENTATIFPRMRDILGFEDMLKNIKPVDLGFMKQLIKPKEGKIYEHSMSFKDWFFCEDREIALKSV